MPSLRKGGPWTLKYDGERLLKALEPLVNTSVVIRDEMIATLRDMLKVATENRQLANTNKDVKRAAEWVRICGYISQCLNTILRDVDLGYLRERMKKLEEDQKRLEQSEKLAIRPMVRKARRQVARAEEQAAHPLEPA